MTDPTQTRSSTLTYADALTALRERAAGSPGTWSVAENESLKLEWIVGPPPELGTPEAVRITRRYVAPVAEDLVQAARALPRTLEIGPIRMEPRTRTLLLGIRPASGRPEGERCPVCGARPRFGTALFGDEQKCAQDAVHASVLGDENGSVLIEVLIVVLLIAVLIGGAMLNLEAAERTRGSRTQVSMLDAAGTNVIETMTERVRSSAALRLGALDAGDLAALNADLASLPVHPGTSLDLAETGYRVVALRELDPIPDDADPLDIWTDQPRIRYSALPRPQGQFASRTVEVEMRVRVLGAGGTRRTLTRTVAVSRIPPFPYVLYRSGAADFCRPAGGASITGAVRVDGAAHFPSCVGAVTVIGTLDARDGVQNDDPRNRFLTDEGGLPIESWSRDAAETGAGAMLAASAGRLRIPAASGGTYEASRGQDAWTAGVGECPDRVGACGGNGYFAPSVTLQRTTLGATPGGTITCGQAYGFSVSCLGAIGAALDYRPWSLTAAASAGTAVPDPANPTRLWRGLLFDPRRESRCTATVAGHTYQTHRCPSNAFGWVLDLARLPAITGGVLYFRAAALDPPGRAAVGAQEVVVIRDAEHLAAPLTIVSDLPVFVVGSLNTVRQAAWRGPPPLMIDAPRVAVLPAEADVQLGLAPGTRGWASLWDLVPPASSTVPSALSLVAASNVTLYAVLRTHVCGVPEGAFQGGALDQAPAAVGDWGAAEVRVVGAVEQTVDATFSAADCRWWGAGFGEAPDASSWRLPGGRTLLYDPRLGHPAFAVPGSYLSTNIPAGGIAGAARRDPARQARANGGYGVLRVVQATGRRDPRASVPFPGTVTLPPAPPPLPK